MTINLALPPGRRHQKSAIVNGALVLTRISDEAFCMDGNDVETLRKAPRVDRTLVNALTGETEVRPFATVRYGDRTYYADAKTGCLFRVKTGVCLTSDFLSIAKASL